MTENSPTDTQIDREFAAVLSTACHIANFGRGLSSVELDYGLAYSGADGGAARAAIQDAIGHVANVSVPIGSVTVTEAVANSDALRARIQSRLDAKKAAAKAKSYTGWSSSSVEPVRYAR